MKIKRIPRPKGTTETKDKQSIILNHYINTGFMYCHQPMTIEQFEHYTGIAHSDITQALVQNGNTLYNLMDTQSQGNILRAFGAMAFSDALADRTRALQQYNVLANAQGQTYKPFISGEVNKALKLTLDSSAQMVNLIKTLTATGPNILISNGAQEPDSFNALTTDEALAMIEAKTKGQAPLLENPQAREQLYIDHGLGDTPEVRANQQQGINTDKEGLNLNQIAKVSDAILLEDEGPQTNHQDRRAQELDIDLESDAL